MGMNNAAFTVSSVSKAKSCNGVPLYLGDMVEFIGEDSDKGRVVSIVNGSTIVIEFNDGKTEEWPSDCFRLVL